MERLEGDAREYTRGRWKTCARTGSCTDALTTDDMPRDLLDALGARTERSRGAAAETAERADITNCQKKSLTGRRCRRSCGGKIDTRAARRKGPAGALVCCVCVLVVEAREAKRWRRATISSSSEREQKEFFWAKKTKKQQFLSWWRSPLRCHLVLPEISVGKIPMARGSVQGFVTRLCRFALKDKVCFFLPPHPLAQNLLFLPSSIFALQTTASHSLSAHLHHYVQDGVLHR